MGGSEMSCGPRLLDQIINQAEVVETMTKDEAVSHAQGFVRSNYPIVPPLALVQHVTERKLGHRQRLQIESWRPFHGSTEMRHSVSLADRADVSSQDISFVTGKWIVAFQMSWDTDMAEMPQALVLAIDDSDSTVTRIR